MKTFEKHPLITGTVILTTAGLLSRILGFFYRIYLSRLFGEEGMGVYQLTGPILSITFALTGASFQNSISKLVSENAAVKKDATLAPLKKGLCFSMPLSFFCTALLFCTADFISLHILQEERCASMLKIMAFAIPLSSIHACICGYYYGSKKAGIPAFSQLLEQLARVGTIWICSSFYLSSKKDVPLGVAAVGLTIGEVFSIGFCMFFMLRDYKKDWLVHTSECSTKSFLSLLLPLTANRISLNILQSLETVSIPAGLRLYRYDKATSLSIYGVLTGMAMPLIFFPNALAGSLSVLLLPEVSEKYAVRDYPAVRKSVQKTITFCGLLGICCTLFFLLFGRFLGGFLFASSLCGYFVTILGLICPFMYVDTALSGILQGMGRATALFLINLCCILVRLAFVLFLIPLVGIRAYLWGLLISQLLKCTLYLICLGRNLTK